MRLFADIDGEEIQAEVLDDFAFDFGEDFLDDFDGFLSFWVHLNGGRNVSMILVVICLALK